MPDAKRLAIIAIVISTAALIISVNNYFRFGGFKDVQNMMLTLESTFETKYNIRTALDQLHEASLMGDAIKDSESFKARIDSATQLLGIAKVTAKANDQKTITEVKEQLRKISDEELWKKHSLTQAINQMRDRLRGVIGE